jgi:mRNA interferase RelE/StbE
MSAGPAYAIKWTETALQMVEAIGDRRIRGQIVGRVGELAKAPEVFGKPLMGELAGYRAVRAVGQRYRIIYRVERGLITVLVVAVGRRKEGDRKDIYELARRLLRQRLLDR